MYRTGRKRHRYDREACRVPQIILGRDSAQSRRSDIELLRDEWRFGFADEVAPLLSHTDAHCAIYVGRPRVTGRNPTLMRNAKVLSRSCDCEEYVEAVLLVLGAGTGSLALT